MKDRSKLIQNMIRNASAEPTATAIAQLLDIVQALNDRMNAVESERKQVNADRLKGIAELRHEIQNPK